ncbi:endonuclease/exonuclease/phosphatase family protein [Caulobacter segnis]|uniref:endonuclease/exonuclease/phosphatase family protein n=1 Tax=Caulobacter segnis TaxID=88688 RepID=UPI0028541D4D|nr:endonuclease/exonuclease/phosphatase family protein [Caulobacter segnis]MDR6626585.1 endonuclease/exonuclease/phosphatase family metal-dependent hydrolase [Caulobacter segnis]
MTTLAPARAETPPPVTFSVMTYNVEGLPWPVRTGRGKALKAIGRELAAMRAAGRQPDVVLIQEGFRSEVWDLIDESGYPYVARGPNKGQRDPNMLRGREPDFRRVKYRRKGEGLGKWGSSGLWVLSDHPINWVKSHAYHYCAGLDCLANKGVMLVSLDVAGLPTPVEVADTHLNSKGASGVPRRRATQAHRLQADELKGFMREDRTPGAPLLVGGDFNVMHSPERFNHVMADYPFEVVSRWCHHRPGACATQISYDGDAPWLDTQDLIGFLDGERVTVTPVAVEATFDGASEPVLSDHDGYKVTFRLTPKG